MRAHETPEPEHPVNVLQCLYLSYAPVNQKQAASKLNSGSHKPSRIRATTKRYAVTYQLFLIDCASNAIVVIAVVRCRMCVCVHSVHHMNIEFILCESKRSAAETFAPAAPTHANIKHSHTHSLPVCPVRVQVCVCVSVGVCGCVCASFAFAIALLLPKSIPFSSACTMRTHSRTNTAQQE